MKTTKANKKGKLQTNIPRQLTYCTSWFDVILLSTFFTTAKDCGAVKTPSNGSLAGNLTTYPHKLQFMCDEGFNLRGSKTRQCLSTGNWSGNESFCEGTIQKNMSKMWQVIWDQFSVIAAIIFTFVAVNCGGLSSPINGSISGNLTVYPNTVTFSCDPGFILRGSSVRKCQSNGTWDGYKTICEGTIFK